MSAVSGGFTPNASAAIFTARFASSLPDIARGVRAVASAWTPGKQLWSKGRLGVHFLKHGDEVGAATPTAYSDAAKAFGSAENTGQFLDTTAGAHFYRFEPATNKVFVGTIAGQKIKTFYQWDGRADDAVITALQEAGKL